MLDMSVIKLDFDLFNSLLCFSFLVSTIFILFTRYHLFYQNLRVYLNIADKILETV